MRALYTIGAVQQQWISALKTGPVRGDPATKILSASNRQRDIKIHCSKSAAIRLAKPTLNVLQRPSENNIKGIYINNMGISIKTASEQEQMRLAGRLTADVLDMIGPHVQPGISTNELDRICHDFIVNTQKAIPAPLNYRGFPKSICTSVNHVVCHGIPADKTIKKG
jgi:Xaa-Pro aminopeptidase